MLLGVMIFVNQIMNIGATTFFALSGSVHSGGRFVLYQILGGIFGLGIQLSFAGLVRYSSVGSAAAIGIGLSYVSVTIFTTYLFFHQHFTSLQWLGSSLVFSGILFITLGNA